MLYQIHYIRILCSSRTIYTDPLDIYQNLKVVSGTTTWNVSEKLNSKWGVVGKENMQAILSAVNKIMNYVKINTGVIFEQWPDP